MVINLFDHYWAIDWKPHIVSQADVWLLGIVQLFCWKETQLKRQVPRNGRWIISEKQSFDSLLTSSRLSHKLPLPQPIILIWLPRTHDKTKECRMAFKKILTWFLSFLTLPLSLMPEWHFLGYIGYPIFWMKHKTNFGNITW